MIRLVKEWGRAGSDLSSPDTLKKDVKAQGELCLDIFVTEGGLIQGEKSYAEATASLKKIVTPPSNSGT